METEWFIQDEWGPIDGPLTSALLKSRADAGMVKPDSQVRKTAGGEWGSARRIKGLFPSLPPEPPEPPKPQALPEPEPLARQTVTEPRLIPCEDCEKLVSIRAASCPQCGCRE